MLPNVKIVQYYIRDCKSKWKMYLKTLHLYRTTLREASHFFLAQGTQTSRNWGWKGWSGHFWWRWGWRRWLFWLWRWWRRRIWWRRRGRVWWWLLWWWFLQRWGIYFNQILEILELSRYCITDIVDKKWVFYKLWLYIPCFQELDSFGVALANICNLHQK